MKNSSVPPVPGLVRLVPYRQEGEPPRRAAVLKVEFPLDGVSDDTLQLLGHLSDAADCMNAIAVHQVCPETEEIASVLEEMLLRAREEGDDEAAADLDAYLDVLRMQNSPWSTLPRKNHLLGMDQKKAAGIAKRAGAASRFEAIARFLFEGVELSDKANFYPEDLSEAEFAGLGEEAEKVNSSIVRNQGGGLDVVVNEARYRTACRAAAGHLRKARAWTKDPVFLLYLDAKIEELATGSAEARRIADYFWIRHSNPADIIISTALEVYQDGWKNLKGQAAAAVTLRSAEAEDFLKRVIEIVPDLEKAAPWTWRRTELDPETLPRLKFVDVLDWTGDYVTSPLTTLAQSLPNDDWTGKNVGTVNLVFRNTGKAVHGVSSGAAAKEFLPAGAVERFGDLLFEAGQIHSTLHEIGHTTGRQDPDHPGEPNGYLKNEFSYIEETRAELFGLWSAPVAAERGIIEPETALAIPYAMLLSMVYALKFDPVQAHYRARNTMYHFFRERGAILETTEGGRRRFDIDAAAFARGTEELLRTTADIKASGDLAGAKALSDRHCRPDPLKTEIEERTRDIPLGRALVFPELGRDGGRFTRDVRYPEFRKQRKFLSRSRFE